VCCRCDRQPVHRKYFQSQLVPGPGWCSHRAVAPKPPKRPVPRTSYQRSGLWHGPIGSRTARLRRRNSWIAARKRIREAALRLVEYAVCLSVLRGCFCHPCGAPPAASVSEGFNWWATGTSTTGIGPAKVQTRLSLFCPHGTDVGRDTFVPRNQLDSGA
jgi:hypothetical protein